MPSDPGDAAVHDVPAGGPWIRAVAVPHGMMPAVAYRIDHGALGLPQRRRGGRASGAGRAGARCDLLVHHQAVPTRETREDGLHAKPTETGATARQAGVGALLVSHFLPEAASELDAVRRDVEATYRGPVLIAHDLMTLEVRPGGVA